MRHWASVVLAAAAICLAAPVIHGWGPEGHHIVARIALGRLTPEAKQGVQALLGPEDLVAAATWPMRLESQRPETYNWHFVDIPFGEMKYDAARDCKPTPQGDCIIAQLERARKDLTDVSLPQERRKEALKSLSLVGAICTCRCTRSTTTIAGATTCSSVSWGSLRPIRESESISTASGTRG